MKEDLSGSPFHCSGDPCFKCLQPCQRECQQEDSGWAWQVSIHLPEQQRGGFGRSSGREVDVSQRVVNILWSEVFCQDGHSGGSCLHTARLPRGDRHCSAKQRHIQPSPFPSAGSAHWVAHLPERPGQGAPSNTEAPSMMGGGFLPRSQTFVFHQAAPTWPGRAGLQ